MLLLFRDRLLRVFIVGIFSSLPIYLADLIPISNVDILFLSFFLFLGISVVDAYLFSFSSWHKLDYCVGLLLPLVTYIALAFLTYLLFKPVVFNRFFLPLRFGCCFFGIKTLMSMVFVAPGIWAIISLASFIGAKFGFSYHTKYGDSWQDK